MFCLCFHPVFDEWFQQSLLVGNFKEGLRRGRYRNSGRRRRGGRLWRRVLSCFGICRICVAMFAHQNWQFFTHFILASCFSQSVFFNRNVAGQTRATRNCWSTSCLYAVWNPWKKCCRGWSCAFSDTCSIGMHWFPNPKVGGQRWDITGDFGWIRESRSGALVLDSPTLSWEIAFAIQWRTHFWFYWLFTFAHILEKKSTFNVSDLLLFLLNRDGFAQNCNLHNLQLLLKERNQCSSRLEFFSDIHKLHVFEGIPLVWKGPHLFFKQNLFAARLPLWQVPCVQGMMQSDVVAWIWLKSAWGVPHRTVCFRHFESFQDLRKQSPCVRLSASTSDRHPLWGCIKVMSWSILVTDLLVAIDKDSLRAC